MLCVCTGMGESASSKIEIELTLAYRLIDAAWSGALVPNPEGTVVRL